MSNVTKVMEMLLCLVLIIWTGSVSSTDCPDRWVAYEGSCYLFEHHQAVNYTEAEHVCNQWNSDLVKVDSQEENSFLKDYMDAYHSIYWLGMTDKAVEGVWRWFVDDSEVEFTDWGPAEPLNVGGGEDCAAFSTYHNYQWADVKCALKYMPLCEIRTSLEEIIG